MNREQLKTLINEAIKEVLSEKTPKGFNPKLKKQITAKKKYIKEQEGDSTDGGEEMPMDPQSSAEPDAGEVEGPESQDLDADPIMAQIDGIINALNSLKSTLSGETEEAGEEEVSDENEMGEEELNGEPEDEQV